MTGIRRAFRRRLAPEDPLMTFCRSFVAVAAAVTLLASASASALEYRTADFSGQLAGGSANVKAPFNSVISQGGPVSGNFVFAEELVPGPTTGFVNVFFSSLPDIALIPPATAFFLDLGGGITFDLGDALSGAAAVQYRNGAFNGFFFVSDFLFQGTDYRLDVQGRTYNIRLLTSGAPSGSNLVNGTLNSALTNVAPFVPVPEPETYALLAAGLGVLVLATRRRSRLAGPR